MTRARSTLIKFAVFATVMSVLTVFLFMAFGEFRSGKVNSYSAVIDDASRLASGDSVRVVGCGSAPSTTLRCSPTTP